MRTFYAEGVTSSNETVLDIGFCVEAENFEEAFKEACKIAEETGVSLNALYETEGE